MPKKYLFIVIAALTLSACGNAAPSASAVPTSAQPAASSSSYIAAIGTATPTTTAAPVVAKVVAPRIVVATKSVAPKICNGHTGKFICLSKKSKKLYTLFNGKIVKVAKSIVSSRQAIVAARFGGLASDGSLNNTRNGLHEIYYKNDKQFSRLYKVKMPFFMAFSGGEGIHYSAEFAKGYPYSHGCAGLKNYAFAAWLYKWADLHTPVMVTTT